MGSTCPLSDPFGPWDNSFFLIDKIKVNAICHRNLLLCIYVFSLPTNKIFQNQKSGFKNFQWPAPQKGQQEILQTKCNSILPNFKNLSNKKKLEIFLYGYNLESAEFDCRNIPLTFAVQKYTLSTKRFSDQNN